LLDKLIIIGRDSVISMPSWNSVTRHSVIRIMSVGIWPLEIKSLCQNQSRNLERENSQKNLKKNSSQFKKRIGSCGFQNEANRSNVWGYEWTLSWRHNIQYNGSQNNSLNLNI